MSLNEVVLRFANMMQPSLFILPSFLYFSHQILGEWEKQPHVCWKIVLAPWWKFSIKFSTPQEILSLQWMTMNWHSNFLSEKFWAVTVLWMNGCLWLSASIFSVAVNLGSVIVYQLICGINQHLIESDMQQSISANQHMTMVYI